MKLEDLSSLSDPSTLRHRRGCRKSVATKIDTHLETLKTKSLLVLDLDDLLSKHRQLEEAISSYEAIQSRLEVVEGPDESLRHATSVGTQRASMESTKVALEKKIKHVNLANDIECLVEDITDTLDSTALGSSATQLRVKDINHTCSELNRKARSQLKDPELKGLWSNLSALKSRLNIKSGEATTGATTTTDPAATLTSPKVDVKSSTVQATPIRIKPPTFDGNPLSWDSFLKLFDSLMSDATSLSNRQRTNLLIEAMSDSHARMIAETAAADGTYESTLKALKEAFGRPRVIFPLHLGSVATTNLKPIAYTRTGMLEAKALLSRTYCGWQTCKSCTAEHILGQLAFNSLTAGARNAWTRFNAGNTEPPTFEHITAFFDQCIADLDGDRCPPATLSKFKAPPLSPKANSKPMRSAHVHTVRSIDTAHRPQPCVFCKEEGHRNYQCPAFKALDVES